jgi:hypothetical protein
MRHLAEQIHAEHPEVQYVQAYRKSGARTHAGAGEQEIWLELTDKGIRFHKEDPRGASVESVATVDPAPREFRSTHVARDAKGRVIGGFASEAEAKTAAGKGGTVVHHPNSVELVDPQQVVRESQRFGTNEKGEAIYVDPRRGPFVVDNDGKLNFGGDLAPADLSDAKIEAYHEAIDAAATHNADGTPREPASLDLGEKVDPAIAERQRQELELRANSPLRPEGIDRVAAEDMAASFRLDEEGGEITAKDLLAELEADDKAIAAMKGCL